MRVDPQVVREAAAGVVLQLVREGDLHVSPLRIDDVKREVAFAMRRALLREDAFERLRRRTRLCHTAPPPVPRGIGRGMLSVAEALIDVLRGSRNVDEVCADDDMLRLKILSVIARPFSAWRTPPAAGGAGSPPSGAGPAGGCPAEARVWDIPPRPRPPVENPDRRERPRVGSTIRLVSAR